MDNFPPIEESIEEPIFFEKEKENISLSPLLINEGFYENLATTLPENVMARIAGKLLDGIQEDDDSRSEWMNSWLRGLKYLGFKLEEPNKLPFTRASRIFDTTLSSALLRGYALFKGELFPNSGPASYEILGPSNEFLDDLGNKISDFINYYLTTIDEDYLSDTDTLLFYLLLIGCAFRKAYIDPTTKIAVLRFIHPQDIIINTNCTSLLSSERITHKEQITRKEYMLRISNKHYREIEIPFSEGEEDESEATRRIRQLEGLDTSDEDKMALYTVYEVQTNLSAADLEGISDINSKSIPLPYIISICASSHKILSLRRNWKEGDPSYKRKNCLVMHKYLPGFGIFGIGLASLLGSNAVALTNIKRMLIDKGVLTNHPGGLKAKGLRIENNNKLPGPSEYVSVDAPGGDIRASIIPMPYGEPSPVLNELAQQIKRETEILAATAEMQIVEHNKQAPVQTTLALLEVANKVQSSVFSSMYASLKQELNLLYDLFKESFPQEGFLFEIPGKQLFMEKSDFIDKVRLIPAASPKLNTSTQRILKAEALLKVAQSAPDLHDMKTVYKRVYEALGVENIDLLMPSPEEAIPLDPITEITQALINKPLKAVEWQDHAAHIDIKMFFLQNHSDVIQQNPQVASILMANIQEHRAMQFKINIETMIGQPLPPLELLQDPQLQNEIAFGVAKMLQEQAQLQNQQQQQQKPIDPNELVLADIMQRKEDSQNRREIAEMKTEEGAFKAQLKFEADKMKIEADKEQAEKKKKEEEEKSKLKFVSEMSKLETEKQLADEDNQTKLALEELKSQERQEKHNENLLNKYWPFRKGNENGQNI